MRSGDAGTRAFEVEGSRQAKDPWAMLRLRGTSDIAGKSSGQQPFTTWAMGEGGTTGTTEGARTK